jgi:hypothetical protein
VLDEVWLDVIVCEDVLVAVSVEVIVREDDFVRMRLVLGVPVSVLVSEEVEEGVLVRVGV